MTTISQVQRKFVANLEKRLADTERLALVLSSQMTEEQFQKIPEEYRVHLSNLLDKISSRGVR